MTAERLTQIAVTWLQQIKVLISFT